MPEELSFSSSLYFSLFLSSSASSSSFFVFNYVLYWTEQRIEQNDFDRKYKGCEMFEFVSLCICTLDMNKMWKCVYTRIILWMCVHLGKNIKSNTYLYLSRIVKYTFVSHRNIMRKRNFLIWAFYWETETHVNTNTPTQLHTNIHNFSIQWNVIQKLLFFLFRFFFFEDNFSYNYHDISSFKAIKVVVV